VFNGRRYMSSREYEEYEVMIWDPEQILTPKPLTPKSFYEWTLDFSPVVRGKRLKQTDVGEVARSNPKFERLQTRHWDIHNRTNDDFRVVYSRDFFQVGDALIAHYKLFCHTVYRLPFFDYIDFANDCGLAVFICGSLYLEEIGDDSKSRGLAAKGSVFLPDGTSVPPNARRSHRDQKERAKLQPRPLVSSDIDLEGVSQLRERFPDFEYLVDPFAPNGPPYSQRLVKKLSDDVIHVIRFDAQLPDVYAEYQIHSHRIKAFFVDREGPSHLRYWSLGTIYMAYPEAERVAENQYHLALSTLM
jgi:hypothetical protein